MMAEGGSNCWTAKAESVISATGDALKKGRILAIPMVGILTGPAQFPVPHFD
jgi:hypothetical protein